MIQQLQTLSEKQPLVSFSKLLWLGYLQYQSLNHANQSNIGFPLPRIV